MWFPENKRGKNFWAERPSKGLRFAKKSESVKTSGQVIRRFPNPAIGASDDVTDAESR